MLNPYDLAESVAFEQAKRSKYKRRAECRKSFAEFFRQSWPVLEPGVPLADNWHIDAICNHLQWMFEDWLAARNYYASHTDEENAAYSATDAQRAQELVINVPPGTAKSRIVSVMFPAWAWLHEPSYRMLCLSANPTVASRDSVYCRELIDSEWYQDTFQPGWRWASDENTKTKYRNTCGGERTARGMSAKVTGNRADIILIDDPNDAKEIHSETTRDNVNIALDQAIGNRLNDLRCSVRLLIMQRLHEVDASGHVLSQGWHHLCLPMEYDPDRACSTAFGWSDPRTEKGELLHPARFPRNVLDKEQTRLGSFGYAGQMQQRPSPAGGEIFQRKWWGWYRLDKAPDRPRPLGVPSRVEQPAIEAPKFEWIYVSIDAAFKGAIHSDRVSMIVVGGRQADRFVLEDRTRVRTFTQTCAAIRQLREDYPRAGKFLIEDKANGTAIVDTLGGEIPGMVPINPEGGKESRAWACSPQIESGNVYLLDGAAWANEWLDEFDVFPNGRNDDRVDALTQLLIHMTRSPAAARAARLLGG